MRSCTICGYRTAVLYKLAPSVRGCYVCTWRHDRKPEGPPVAKSAGPEARMRTWGQHMIPVDVMFTRQGGS